MTTQKLPPESSFAPRRYRALGSDGTIPPSLPDAFDMNFDVGEWAPSGEIILDDDRLEAARIIGHNNTDPRTKSYDILRTHLLQSMDLHNWHIVGITSPTKACGKTLTSINLALSIARQANRAVLLVDMDLRKPQLASRLELEPRYGLLDVLQGQVSALDAIYRVRAGNHQVLVLPAEATEASSEFMASPAMRTFILELRRTFQTHIVILDLPPLLVSDDVISILPRIDTTLLVTAVGTSTPAEIEECGRHLQSTNLVRIVVNKAPVSAKAHYY